MITFTKEELQLIGNRLDLDIEQATRTGRKLKMKIFERSPLLLGGLFWVAGGISLMVFTFFFPPISLVSGLTIIGIGLALLGIGVAVEIPLLISLKKNSKTLCQLQQMKNDLALMAGKDAYADEMRSKLLAGDGRIKAKVLLELHRLAKEEILAKSAPNYNRNWQRGAMFWYKEGI
ncbi:MAG: hypothetical protein K0S07_336 [Chlamydiales bacterium]|nr:hypothetical protein [Chlamydiales bacterium]